MPSKLHKYNQFKKNRYSKNFKVIEKNYLNNYTALNLALAVKHLISRSLILNIPYLHQQNHL
jgi:hypothetical protein